MPEEIEHRKEKTEKEKLFEKIERHLNYLREEDEKLLFEDGRQTGLLSENMKMTSPDDESIKKFQNFKSSFRADHEKSLEQLKKDKPGKELLEKLSLPTREEDVAMKLRDRYVRSLEKGEIENKDEENYVQERIKDIIQRIDVCGKEREGWLSKIKNLKKEE